MVAGHVISLRSHGIWVIPVLGRIPKLFDPAAVPLAFIPAIGGFEQDRLPDINGTIYNAHGSDEAIATFLADAVVVCLNSDPHHLISNFPPTTP